MSHAHKESHPQDYVEVPDEQRAAELEVERSVKAVSNRTLWIRVAVFGGIVLLLMLGVGAAFAPNVATDSRQYLYIQENADFQAVSDSIAAHGGLYSAASFGLFATLTGYTGDIQPGRYLLEPGMSNFTLLRNLKGGRQYPVRLVVQPRRSLETLAKQLTRGLKLTQYELLVAMNSTAFLGDSLGFAPEERLAMFIPNTYEVYWNTGAKKLLRRLKKEYNAFWTAARLKQAEALKLSPIEVSIVASIVEEETRQNDEKNRIAGVYLNRLREGWRLQADPTVKFAVGDFSIRRVKHGHLKTDSPYNTYKYKGLPPGPINNPSIASIDAVLNAEQHDFFYFVADLDRPGYHSFSKENEYKAHVNKANKYRDSLDERGID